MVISAQHKLAKFLNSSLELVLKHFLEYSLKDSFTFVNKIKEMEANNTLIASFDVQVISIKVPLEEVIEICVDTLYNRGGQRTARGPDPARRVKMTGPQTFFNFKWNPARGQH